VLHHRRSINPVRLVVDEPRPRTHPDCRRSCCAARIRC
jgi:hypothetical protein